MRTIVVFEAGSKLLYAELGDFGVVPTVGFTLEHEGAMYGVTEVVVSPAVFKPAREKKAGEKDVPRSGFQKLLAIVSRLNAGKTDEAYALIASMESIGTGDRPTVSPGGIELPTKLTPQFDDVLYLRTKQTGKRLTKAAGTQIQLLRMFGEGTVNCGCDTTTGGENIVLTDAAAK